MIRVTERKVVEIAALHETFTEKAHLFFSFSSFHPLSLSLSLLGIFLLSTVTDPAAERDHRVAVRHGRVVNTRLFPFVFYSHIYIRTNGKRNTENIRKGNNELEKVRVCVCVCVCVCLCVCVCVCVFFLNLTLAHLLEWEGCAQRRQFAADDALLLHDHELCLALSRLVQQIIKLIDRF